MVTLAFAQMLYYFAQSLRAAGAAMMASARGGAMISASCRSTNHEAFYYVVLVLLVVVVWLSYRLVRSEFGMVIRGIRDNERRAAAIGFPPYPYKLVIFVIAGGIAGPRRRADGEPRQVRQSGGAELAALSGELLAMVILGSANSLIGPVIGAAFFLAFRDVLSDYTEHWMLFFGPLLVARVLLMKDGIWGMRRCARPAPANAPRAEGRLSRDGNRAAEAKREQDRERALLCRSNGLQQGVRRADRDRQRHAQRSAPARRMR